MRCKFEEESVSTGRSLRRSAPGRGRSLWTTIRQTALLLVVGVAAIGGSRLPAAATPQDVPATALPCLLPPNAAGVLVLFSGKADELTQNFTHADGTAPTWKVTDDGSLVAQDADLMSKQGFGDCQLHVEFKIPQKGGAAGEEWSSGIVLHGRFAMQICDSSGISQPGAKDCGAVFNLLAPRVNACKAPEEWQSYDIIFRAARFATDGKTRLEAARVTAFLNGVLVQNNVEILAPTGDLKIGAADKPAPFLLQYHGCAMAFRNIWALPLSQTAAEAPAAAPDKANGQVVFNWQDAPKDEQIPVDRVLFDQGGYQVQCGGGETIVVPFANENLDAMKFGRSGTDSAYFVNDGSAPTLYLSNEGYLESAVAQDTRWFPFAPGYTYTSPIYVGLAPTWRDYTTMGWYNGMTVYGGVVRSTRNASVIWMPGYHTVINQVTYPTYIAYRNYLARKKTYARNRVVYVNYATRPTGFWGRNVVNGQSGGGTISGGPVPPRTQVGGRTYYGKPVPPRNRQNSSRGAYKPQGVPSPSGNAQGNTTQMKNPNGNGGVSNPPINRPQMNRTPAPNRPPVVNRPTVMNRPRMNTPRPASNPPPRNTQGKRR